MNTPQHLAQLLTMPPADFERYVGAVNQLALLRRDVEGSSLPDPSATEDSSTSSGGPRSLTAALGAVAAAAPRTEPKRLVVRRPMRAAKAGTLRGEIHEVLRAGGKPLRRAEIISAVAKRRGQPVDGLLTGKIGDILRNRHDPFVRRVGHGTYVFVGQSEVCL